jgi:hypothetical protein
MKKINKTIFGIPRTPIDDNTVFYASFDGTVVPEVGSGVIFGTPTLTYKPTLTGLGTNSIFNYSSTSISGFTDTMTIDCVINMNGKPSTSWGRFFVITTNSNNMFSLQHDTDNNNLFVGCKINGVNLISSSLKYSIPSIDFNKAYHIRVVIVKDKWRFYLNGVLICNIQMPAIADLSLLFQNPLIFIKNSEGSTSALTNPNTTISDFSISNIDRGDYFPTLPKDFIDSKAIIVPSFNNQRKTYSDALTSQYTQLVVRGNSATQEKGVAVTQATAGTWASGDIIKVKGLGGEIIGGVVDSDTALARIIGMTEGTNDILYLDDISKLSVNDTFKMLRGDGTVSSEYSITAIDTTNKTVTLNTNVFTSGDTGNYIIESTTSSSTPTVKFMNGTTLTSITGTWSNLGTNEATFTFGTNASLTNQDIQIEYSLNMVAGQGQVPVYSDILGGDVNGKKLSVGTVVLRDDFKGKISGSVVECPHVSKVGYGTSLLSPSSLIGEIWTNEYAKISSLNGTVYNYGKDANNIAQHGFSFNLIRLVEDKFGKIPSVNKVQWLKDNISKITCNWYGYGTCPSGNLNSFAPFNILTNAWVTGGWGTVGKTNANIAVSTVFFDVSNASFKPSDYVDTNGFCHFLAYTNASDGVTASTIYTDYCYIEVELKTPTNYTVLVPDNPRRDEAWHITMADMKKTDDFKNKVSGSTVECAHVIKHNESLNNTTLLTPSGFVSEFTQTYYNYIISLNTITKGVSTSINGSIAQTLFSFNLIEYVERKYGKIPAVDKITWLKNNINKIVSNWYGYGSCPSGNKASFAPYYNDGQGWTGAVISNTSNSPSLLIIPITNVSTRIQSDGFVHFLAYTDASDGVTASTIYTDYINIEVELKDTTITQLDYFKNKWVKNNVLTVRKETKEIQTFFPSDGDIISVVGNYLPYRGLGDIITKAKILAVGDPIITTLGTGGVNGLTDYSGLNALSTRLPSVIEDYKLIDEKFISDGLPTDIDKLRLKNNSIHASGNTRRLYPVEGLYLQPSSTLVVSLIRGINKRPLLSSDSVVNGGGQMILQCSLPQTLPSEAVISLPMLVTENNKLYMVVVSTKKTATDVSNTLIFYASSITYDVFDLQGKPIIK